MRLLEDVDETGHPGLSSPKEAVRLFGVPGFVYRQIVRQMVGDVKSWMVSSIRRRPAEAFMHENDLRFMLSYVKTRYRDENARQRRSVAAELGSFTTNLLRKKVRTTLGRG
jgi:hypothetical protein